MTRRIELADANRFAIYFFMKMGAGVGAAVALLAAIFVDILYFSPRDTTFSFWHFIVVMTITLAFWGFIVMLVFSVYHQGMYIANLVYRDKEGLWLETGEIRKRYEKLDADSVAVAHLWCVDRFMNARKYPSWSNMSTWLTLVMADGRTCEFALRETVAWEQVYEQLVANNIAVTANPLSGRRRWRGRRHCNMTIKVGIVNMRGFIFEGLKNMVVAFVPAACAFGVLILIRESFIWEIRWLAWTLIAIAGIPGMVWTVRLLIGIQPKDYLTISSEGLISRRYGLMRWDTNRIQFHMHSGSVPVTNGDGVVSSVRQRYEVMTVMPEKATDSALSMRYMSAGGSGFGDLISACLHHGRVACAAPTYTELGGPTFKIRNILPAE